MIPQLSIICQRSTLAKVKFPQKKKKKTCMGSITSSIAYNSNTYPPPSKEEYVLIFNLYTNKINFLQLLCLISYLLVNL